MDIFAELWQSGFCETRRFCPTIAGAAHQGGGAFEAGPLVSSGGPPGSVLDQFTGPLDAILSARRQGGLEAPTDAWASAAAGSSTEASIGWAPKTRRTGGGLPNRAVDRAARGRANSTAFGRGLSSRARLENSDRVGLELSEARAPGPATQPPEDSRVETAGLAAYKKKPGACVPIWFSSMKAALC